MIVEHLALLRALLPQLDAVGEHGVLIAWPGVWPRGLGGVRPTPAMGRYHLTAKQAVRLAEAIRSELALIEGEPCP